MSESDSLKRPAEDGIDSSTPSKSACVVPKPETKLRLEPNYFASSTMEEQTRIVSDFLFRNCSAENIEVRTLRELW